MYNISGKFGNAERKDREMGHLYALDFDGVICDSCGETAISALKVYACSLTLSLLPLVTMKMEENSRK